MPRIVEEVSYDGATERIARLGLTAIVEEVRSLIRDYDLRVLEVRDGNGGAFVRKLLDERFQERGGWVKKQTGDVDWTKCHAVNGTKVCVGVELQISGRSDMIAVDLIHLRARVIDGQIDLGILVVPDNVLSVYLTDRGPSIADAKHHAEQARVTDWPLLIIAFHHDGPGPALPKQFKSPSGQKQRKSKPPSLAS